MSEKITGAEALIRSLIAEGVDCVFGYPGGTILSVYDQLYAYSDQLEHILVRHEQGAIHAAEGYARVSNRVGVVIVTSGPGAGKVVTGLSDAMMDSTPIVVISGQVNCQLLGNDSFQETDVVGITLPVTKWSLQVRRAEDVPHAIAKAFYIARSGRPGPVVLDISKDAQTGLLEWEHTPVTFIRSYDPDPEVGDAEIAEAARMVNEARRPLILAGHGIMIAEAEEQLALLAEKGDIPVATTLLGLSTLPSNHPLNVGMLGMHGNVAPNYLTNEADLLIALGMRFDDRVTGDLKRYAPEAKIIHVDIDPSELDRNVRSTCNINGDVRKVLERMLPMVEKKSRQEWLDRFHTCHDVEKKTVKRHALDPSGPLKMGEVAECVAQATGNRAVLVTDVGQNQMMGARYFRFTDPRSFITSGGLGTMGFGLPAAIGAKIGAPDRTVCLLCGDGGIQMTIEEFGTIMQYGVAVKIIVLNNNYLGNVRQWQELFFNSHYSQTPMLNPDFCMIARAYGIESCEVTEREQLLPAVERMLHHDGPFLLNVHIYETDNVFPMITPGSCVTDILLDKETRFVYPSNPDSNDAD